MSTSRSSGSNHGVKSLRRLCVFAGSRTGIRHEFITHVQELGRELAKRQIAMVYGGASVGLMGVLADAVLEAGGEVFGVVPRQLFRSETPHSGLTKLYEVSSMHRRKALMADLSDAFVALPGGFGTFDELFEAVTWAQIGVHSKPIALYNIAGYFDPLVNLVEHAIAEGFISSSGRALLRCDRNTERLLDQLADAVHETSRTQQEPRLRARSSLPEA